MTAFILLVIAGFTLWLFTIWLFLNSPEDNEEPLEGMSNPILFEEMRDKYFRK